VLRVRKLSGMNVPNELKLEVRRKRKTVPADRERLPFGWTPSPAYPGRLGVAGSVLIIDRFKWYVVVHS
jgi:hypothetical protein